MDNTFQTYLNLFVFAEDVAEMYTMKIMKYLIKI